MSCNYVETWSFTTGAVESVILSIMYKMMSFSKKNHWKKTSFCGKALNENNGF